MTKKLTPAQQQFHDIKSQYPDAILFFRMGDFYETFYDDAELCHKVLDITLTARDKKSDNPIPMAGVPHHSVEKYIQKLVQSGYKVAVADQVGPVVPGKVVERKVVRIVTPGTAMGDEGEISYMLSLTCREGSSRGEVYHIAWGDFVLGHYKTQSFQDLTSCLQRIQSIHPSEVIIDVDFPEIEEARNFLATIHQGLVSIHDTPHDLQQWLQDITQTTSLKGFGDALLEGRRHAMGLLLHYICNTQQSTLSNIHSIQHQVSDGVVHLDGVSLRNLEVFASAYEHNKKQSLYHVINNTRTAMGSRLLQYRLSNPTNNLTELEQRLSLISYYQEQEPLLELLRRVLKQLPDLPRVQARLLYRKPSAMLFQSLRNTFDYLFGPEALEIKQELLRIGLGEQDLNHLVGFYAELIAAIKDEQISDDMNFVAAGYDDQIDELSDIAYHSDDKLVEYQQQLSQLADCQVKLKFVTNQGYFVEVSQRDVDKLESIIDQSDPSRDLIRRQTLKTSERYVSTYLLKLQEKILTAKDELKQREHAVLAQLVEQLVNIDSSFGRLCDLLGEMDLASSNALYAKNNNWIQPELHTEYEIDIRNGRHPIVEQYLPKHEQFIPNDTHLSGTDLFHLLTGPNMGGKSTYLRQNALIVLLAHAGLYVPADQAKIALVDGIYARVGSGDALAQQQSTFMTEMLEMANILNNATNKSFIILDELGRGTSTYDGMALAKAIIVYMCQQLSSKVLFATHYHELTDLEGQVDGVVNYSVSVYEKEKDVLFLKKVVRGGASKSYGVDVAKLAGVPAVVLDMARQYLTGLEQQSDGVPQQVGFNFGAINDTYKQLYDELHKELETYDVNEVTPIEALVKLQEIKKLLK